MTPVEYFEELRAHYENARFKDMAAMFRYPVSITRTHPVEVVPDCESMAAKLQKRWEANRDVGCASYTVVITGHTTSVRGLHFVDVVWSLYDAHGVKGVDYPASYTLISSEDGMLRSSSLVSHDDKACREEMARRVATRSSDTKI